MDIYIPLLKGPNKPHHFPYESNFGGSKTLRNGHDDAAVVTRLHVVGLKVEVVGWMVSYCWWFRNLAPPEDV